MPVRKISLHNTLLIYLVIIAILSILCTGYIWIASEKTRFEKDSALLRDSYVERQKETIITEANRALDFVNYMRTQTENRLKDSVKKRVYEAHSIAMNLYGRYASTTPASSVNSTIREALRPIRFNNGRGYFFAFNLEGIEELFADKPEMEGKSMMDIRGGKGEAVVPDMIALVKEKGEGFYYYTWSKPGQTGYFPKIAFVKLIEPIGWAVGTGEYLDDVEQDIKAECLQWLSNIRFGKDGYIFVGQWDGLSLAGPGANTNAFEITDVNGVKFVQQIIRAAMSGGGFVQYVFPSAPGKKHGRKLSYVTGVEEWRWYIGAGLYVDEIEEEIARKQMELNERISRHIQYISLILVSLLTAVFIIVNFLSRKIHRNLASLAAFFGESRHGQTKIDPNAISFSEFSRFAEAINEAIVKQKTAEAELGRSEQRFRQLVELLPQTVFEMDLGGKITFVNNNAFKVFGYAPEDIQRGLNVVDIIAPEDRAQAISNIQKVLRGEIESAGRRYMSIRKNGIAFPVLVYSNIRSEDNRAIGLQGIVIDISQQEKIIQERDRFKEQYIQAQKIEAIGLLAGGIAHDLNNMLSPILGYGELLLNSSFLNSSARKPVERMLSAGIRAKEMVHQLLAYSRKQALEIKTVNVNEVLSGFEPLLKRMLRENIHLQFILMPNIPTIEVDTGQLEQVIMNLSINSQDAMPDGGKLTIETDAVTLDEHYAAVHRAVKPGQYVRVIVSDTGHGMDSKTQERIFDPFYTTKGQGKGTGLGLSTVYGIVKQHRGNIWVYSEPGRGTVFKIYFPVSKLHSSQEALKPQVLDHLHGTETIMIVEDNEAVRELSESILSLHGYKVLSASGGGECLQLLSGNRVDIDLLLTDVIMPDMNGQELYTRVKTFFPEIKVLYMSGYTDDVIVHHGVLEEGIDFIQKPFSVVALATKVREILDRNDEI